MVLRKTLSFDQLFSLYILMILTTTTTSSISKFAYDTKLIKEIHDNQGILELGRYLADDPQCR